MFMMNGQFSLTEADQVHAEQEMKTKTVQEEQPDHMTFNTQLIELASEEKWIQDVEIADHITMELRIEATNGISEIYIQFFAD